MASTSNEHKTAIKDSFNRYPFTSLSQEFGEENASVFIDALIDMADRKSVDLKSLSTFINSYSLMCSSVRSFLDILKAPGFTAPVYERPAEDYPSGVLVDKFIDLIQPTISTCQRALVKNAVLSDHEKFRSKWLTVLAAMAAKEWNLLPVEMLGEISELFEPEVTYKWILSEGGRLWREHPEIMKDYFSRRADATRPELFIERCRANP